MFLQGACNTMLPDFKKREDSVLLLWDRMFPGIPGKSRNPKQG